jgi:hypothetical protein
VRVADAVTFRDGVADGMADALARRLMIGLSDVAQHHLAVSDDRRSDRRLDWLLGSRTQSHLGELLGFRRIAEREDHLTVRRVEHSLADFVVRFAKLAQELVPEHGPEPVFAGFGQQLRHVAGEVALALVEIHEERPIMVRAPLRVEEEEAH